MELKKQKQYGLCEEAQCNERSVFYFRLDNAYGVWFCDKHNQQAKEGVE